MAKFMPEIYLRKTKQFHEFGEEDHNIEHVDQPDGSSKTISNFIALSPLRDEF